MRSPWGTKKKPNAFGRHDVHGHVWEWCQDAESAASRVLRGGSWHLTAVYPWSPYRRERAPVLRRFDLGFRFVRDSP